LYEGPNYNSIPLNRLAFIKVPLEIPIVFYGANYTVLYVSI